MPNARTLPVLILVGGAIATFAFFQSQRINTLRAENEDLKRQISELKDATAQMDKLKKDRDQAVKQAQRYSTEVLSLRNQTSQLLKQKNESAIPSPTGRRQDGASQPQAAPPPVPSEPVPALATFPRDSWQFAGYATPENALVSAIWAMREGDPQAYFDSLSKEEQIRMAKAWEGKSEQEIAAKHQADVAAISGMRIMDHQVISPTETRMSVYIDGANRQETVSMKLVDGSWKFGGFIRNP
ncbi:MAG TPA: hypothetical protein VK968_08585 [Roseimicrobium sp.]|nr:hypothetical protein [Roseimicrobium sp.]